MLGQRRYQDLPELCSAGRLLEMGFMQGSSVCVNGGIVPANSTSGDLASLLRCRRRHAGLSQQALADLSTVSARAIRDLESGRATRPRRNTVNLLADGLRVGDADRSALLAAIPGMGIPEHENDAPGAVVSLPMAPSPMLGRTGELGILRDHMIVASERLVAVVGVSGVGKTRLAVEFAHELAEHNGYEVHWISAGETYDRNEVRTTVSSRVTAMLGQDSVDPAAANDLLGSGNVLLVLDGFAVGSWSTGLTGLLNACPNLRILLTTDAADGAVGWKIVPLAPLPVPAVGEDATRSDSFRFLDRHLRGTGACGTDPHVLAAICRLVDGIPSTLELVGQWTTVHTLDRLAVELSRDPFALASWPSATGTVYDPGESLRRSFERLPSSARDLLCGLAVGGPWSVPAAAEHIRRPLCEVACDMHTLLLHGQVRRVDGPAGPRFVVLRLARRIARPELGRVTSIDGGIPLARTDRPGRGEPATDCFQLAATELRTADAM